MDPVSHHHAAVYISTWCTFHMSEGKGKTYTHTLKHTMLKTTPNSLLTLQVSMWKQVLRNEQSPSDSETEMMQTCEMNSVNNIWAYFWAYLDYFWASFHSPSSLQQQRQMLRSTTMKQLGLYSNNNCQQQPMSMKDLTSITTGVTFHTNMLQSHLVSSLCSIMSAASYTSTLESTVVQAHKYSREYSSTSTQVL